jgi:Ni/Co efflux regulator RcnB
MKKSLLTIVALAFAATSALAAAPAASAAASAPVKAASAPAKKAKVVKHRKVDAKSVASIKKAASK